VGEEEQMKQTPNVQRATPINSEQARNAEVSADSTTSNIKHRRSNIFWRIVDFVVAGIFIYAGALKMLDPVQFAHDVKNFQILPWRISVALAFYLPWLEIFCGVGLVFRFFYRGALCILSALIVVFTLATAAAKVRGLDITCGCFGHASQHWSFPAHLATNLGILAALLLLGFSNRSAKPL
jgi:putative oxidoreductase